MTIHLLLSYIWTGLIGLSLFCALLTGNTQALSASVMEGCRNAVNLILTMGGSICLWTGVGRLLEASGITSFLSRLLFPLLSVLFPESKKDSALAGDLSANFCANLLGLGNAATPMGISAAKRLARGDTTASDSLCRLIVLNTASIQLLPTNIAAMRSALGAAAPFDILPAVWITSILSVSLGLSFAFVLGKICR